MVGSSAITYYSLRKNTETTQLLRISSEEKDQVTWDAELLLTWSQSRDNDVDMDDARTGSVYCGEPVEFD